MIIETKDRILLRRLVNQHNIECLTKDKRSEYCMARITRCLTPVDPFNGEICCDRCFHRGSIAMNPTSAFIGYTPQV